VRGGQAAVPLSARTARRLAAALLIGLAAPAWGQHLLLGYWKSPPNNESDTMLVIISEDREGWIQGVVQYLTPRDGFTGAPFTTKIENGAFAIRFLNGTRYADMHWCREDLCGTFYAADGTATPVDFTRIAH
jgi:hypothetical protein